jgi:ribosome recycling factor
VLPAIEKGHPRLEPGTDAASDGNVVRLTIPPLTGERRKELVKQVKKIGEEYKVAIRNIRRDANETLKKSKKDKEISEDDLFRLQEEAQKTTDAFITQVDGILRGKEKEVMEV